MNGYELLAFVIMPIAVTAFGWAVVLVNEHYDKPLGGTSGDPNDVRKHTDFHVLG
jgi:hypothetical protein